MEGLQKFVKFNFKNYYVSSLELHLSTLDLLLLLL